ncbi:Glutathione S-transferase [Hyella patelloides LEGE 07179]|uniref:Glutathione S-transferase n=1 Tax=Hyella patelloides LEGE 07179 TaxID=945734 RepID=A0A563W075_9CYAN|nr:glutathione S-transferase family protein [Hyella patelloides]VEP17112.1 Glutathione S-transferase [Hyella patelloides LEGE 07179]
MLKLYGGSRSRASIVQWYLEELDVPYEFVLLDMANGEHLQPDFQQINPMGKVPAIIDGDFKLWESGAILLYLGEKHGQMPSSLTEKSIIQQWVLFANSTLATGLFVEASREKETPQLLNPLNQLFTDQPYILGTDFTVADVEVGSVLAYVPTMLPLDLSPYPQVLEYIKRICARPVWQKLFATS